MFSRRRIAVLAAAFVALDPMSYVMSRISMNDIFVATFIVAAYLVFWQIWSGRWARSAWWALPLVGVLIGLAAATSGSASTRWPACWCSSWPDRDLGRLVLVALVALGAVDRRRRCAVAVPASSCSALLALALAITWVRPIRLDVGESADGALPATRRGLTGVGLAFVVRLRSLRCEGRASRAARWSTSSGSSRAARRPAGRCGS